MCAENKKRRGRFFRYAPLILWICVVLFASTTTASMSNTSRIIRPLLQFFFPNAPEETLIIYHGYIRKLAHLTEYGILAFFASRAFWNSSVRFLQKYWFSASFILVITIASIDEYNQSFNPARTGSVYDVLIDAFGATLVILMFYAYKIFWEDRKNKVYKN